MFCPSVIKNCLEVRETPTSGHDKRLASNWRLPLKTHISNQNLREFTRGLAASLPRCLAASHIGITHLRDMGSWIVFLGLVCVASTLNGIFVAGKFVIVLCKQFMLCVWHGVTLCGFMLLKARQL